MSQKNQPHHQLDITLDLCPMTFVKTRLELEEMNQGELLEVILREGEPLSNVTRSVEDLGHRIQEKSDQGNGVWRIVIVRGESG